MQAGPISVDLSTVERRLRVVAILTYCDEAGMAPVNGDLVHSIAYLTDALAPVWHLPILDGQVLKRRLRPFFPLLQHDIDCLVGMGVVRPTKVAFRRSDDEWRLDADYALVPRLARRIIETAEKFPAQLRNLTFVREVVFAASGLGTEGLAAIGEIDAAYSDPLLDIGAVVDIDPDFGAINASARIAQRFSELAQGGSQFLTDAQLVHLYVRHLYTRMQVA